VDEETVRARGGREDEGRRGREGSAEPRTENLRGGRGKKKKSLNVRSLFWRGGGDTLRGNRPVRANQERAFLVKKPRRQFKPFMSRRDLGKEMQKWTEGPAAMLAERVMTDGGSDSENVT